MSFKWDLQFATRTPSPQNTTRQPHASGKNPEHKQPLAIRNRPKPPSTPCSLSDRSVTVLNVDNNRNALASNCSRSPGTIALLAYTPPVGPHRIAVTKRNGPQNQPPLRCTNHWRNVSCNVGCVNHWRRMQRNSQIVTTGHKSHRTHLSAQGAPSHPHVKQIANASIQNYPWQINTLPRDEPHDKTISPARRCTLPFGVCKNMGPLGLNEGCLHGMVAYTGLRAREQP